MAKIFFGAIVWLVMFGILQIFFSFIIDNDDLRTIIVGPIALITTLFIILKEPKAEYQKKTTKKEPEKKYKSSIRESKNHKPLTEYQQTNVHNIEQRILDGNIRSNDIELINGLYYFKHDLTKLVNGKVRRYLGDGLRYSYNVLFNLPTDIKNEKPDKEILISEVEYKEGKKHGIYKSWHANGQLSSQYYIKEGKIDGIYRSWYDNGQLEKEYNTKDGNLNGIYKCWYDDGQLENEFYY